jgi:hypothetical protein
MSTANVNSAFESQGVRANRHKEFQVVFTGDRWYRLLALLEKPAEQSREFSELCPYVEYVLDIRRQLKQRGF